MILESLLICGYLLH